MAAAGRDQRGQVLTSVLAVVSLVMVVGAAVGLVFTGSADSGDASRGAERSTAGEPDPAPTSEKGDRPGKHKGTDKGTDNGKDKGTDDKPRAKNDREPHAKPTKGPGPVPDVYVEVYNNTGITGLAASTAARLEARGWDVVGIANWYGEVEATAVYAPPQLREEARRLARALGVGRTAPAVPPMDSDKLTVILTSDYAG